MILDARERKCLADVLVIASALSVPDPRERPLDRAQAADQAHLAFRDERSDFLSLIALWEFFAGLTAKGLSHRRRVEACRAQFVSYLRMIEWRDIHAQLHAVLTEAGWRIEGALPASIDTARYATIHRALLAGLLGNIGTRAEPAATMGGQYDGARGIRFYLHPGSGLAKKTPKWVLAAELTQTTRLYARCAARIEPEWIEAVAGERVARDHFDAHWERARGEVVASERVRLYGLTLVARRSVVYGPIAPAHARDVFIREALVADDLGVDAPFAAHNRALVADIAGLEQKARREDVLVDDDVIAAFFAEQIPADVHSRATFERWRKAAERRQPRLLFLTREALMRHGAQGVTEKLFPETLHVAGGDFPLQYRFAPGHPLDGLTLSLPLARLNQLGPAELSWLVPGMVRDKVTLLIRALPKALRNRLVPLPETVTQFLSRPRTAKQSLEEALSAYLEERVGDAPTVAALAAIELPPHLRIIVRIVDAAGEELAMDRDVRALRERLSEAARLSFAAEQPAFERKGLRRWDFGELPESIAIRRDGERVVGYPALIDDGDAVSLTLLDTAEAAMRATRAGVKRLIVLELGSTGARDVARSTAWNGIALQLRGAIPLEKLQHDVADAIADRAFIGDDPLPRDRDAFVAQVRRARARLPAVTETALRTLQAIAAEYQALSQLLAALPTGQKPLGAEIRRQRDALVHPGFFAETPWDALQHLPRYLRALIRRVQRQPQNPERDARHAAQVAQWWARYEERMRATRRAGHVPQRLTAFRWLLEELRVSLFAQELRTPFPVSLKRVEKAWGELARGG